MAAILTERTAVLYGLAVSSTKAEAVTAQFRAPLRKLVAVDSVVAVVGELARKDGWDYARPVLYVDAAPRHLRIVMDELLSVQPSVVFALNSGNIMHQVQLLDAQTIWGHRALPARPWGNAFAARWAQLRLRQRHRDIIEHPEHAQVGIGGVEDWLTLRTIMQLDRWPMPGTLDLPKVLQMLYVSRNVQHRRPPAELKPVRDSIGELAADSLDALAVQGALVSELGRTLRGRFATYTDFMASML